MAYSWKFLQENIRNGTMKSDLNLLRKVRVQKAYDAHLKHVDSKYASREDYIKIHSLGWTPIAQNGKTVATKSAHSKNSMLELNIFPYNLHKDIHHYILWSVTPVHPLKMDSICYKTFINTPYLWFVNCPQNRSIPALWHAHIFVKQH
jgi:Protein of unknown function (DUF3605)